MILAVDIGNTTTMVGIYEAEKLTGFYHIASKTNRETGLSTTADEIGLKIRQLLQIHHRADVPVEKLVVCSVVPDLIQVYTEMAEKYFKAKTWVLDHESDLGMKIDVDEPAQVGPDRLANAIAVKEVHGSPAIVVDLGTATTFDVVNDNGDYVGGAIAPGILTSSAELFRKASRLFPVQLEKPDRCIGSNTADSMKSGIFYGALGMIDYIVEKIIAELGKKKVKVIATGGYAEMFSLHSKYIQKVDPVLTLTGLILAYKRNNVTNNV